MHRYVIFCLFSTFLHLLQLDADHRDYCLSDKNCDYYCYYDLPKAFAESRESILSDGKYGFHIPDDYGPQCTHCMKRSCYLGYWDPDFEKYLPHLKRQIRSYYLGGCTNCSCYWPEHSWDATEINDIAYILFRDLIITTELHSLLKDENEQKKFIENKHCFLNLHGLTISFIVLQFMFSDYYRVCRDIDFRYY